MLKEFRVKNFKSINQEQIFSMEACPQKEVSEYPGHVLNINGNRLLKVSSFYGPNGGGKTTLFVAIVNMIHVAFGDQIIDPSLGNENQIPCVFSNSKETTFEAFFVNDDFEIGYSLTVDMSRFKRVLYPGNNFISYVDFKIKNEEMICRSKDSKEFKTIFERNGEGVVKSNCLTNVDLINTGGKISVSLSFLSYYVRTFNKESNREIFSLNEELSNIRTLIRETRSYVFEKPVVNILTPYLQQATKILNGLDFRISDLRFKLFEPGKYGLCVIRKTKEGKETSIQLANESNGTRKIINLIFDILDTSKSAIFIADDFDSHLHPKLIRAIIELFTSQENTNKQLIINSHDITNMNNQVFRRDEIWFAYRDEDYASQYVPLSNIVNYKGEMVRKDAKYGKQYLEGRYGADPFIKQGLSWNK